MPKGKGKGDHSMGGLSDSDDSSSSEESTLVKLRLLDQRKPKVAALSLEDTSGSSSSDESFLTSLRAKKVARRKGSPSNGTQSPPRRGGRGKKTTSPVLREGNSASIKSRSNGAEQPAPRELLSRDQDKDVEEDEDFWDDLDDDFFGGSDVKTKNGRDPPSNPTTAVSSKQNETANDDTTASTKQAIQPESSRVFNPYKTAKRASSPEPHRRRRHEDEKQEMAIGHDDSQDLIVLEDVEDDQKENHHHRLDRKEEHEMVNGLKDGQDPIVLDEDDQEESKSPFFRHPSPTEDLNDAFMEDTALDRQEQPIEPKAHDTTSGEDVQQIVDQEADQQAWLDDLVNKELEEVDREMGLSGKPSVETMPTETIDHDAAQPEFNEQLIAEAFGFASPKASADKEQRATLKRPPPSQAARLSGIDMGERHIEVEDPSIYAPEDIDESLEPMVHQFNATSHPIQGRQRVPVSKVFDRHPSIANFFKFDQFNPLQSALSNMIANSDDNLVCSAPTGAGKTAIFEMAMARILSDDLQRNGKFTYHRKVMYLAPSKALCEERFEDWSTRLLPFNLQVASITGDGDPAEAHREIAAAHVIVTTPEKWDSLTRRWTEKFYLFASVKLVLIDECHLLADSSRGACLEALILRLKTIQRAASKIETSQSIIDASSYSNTTPEAIASNMRMVAVSATLPNIDEIAKFIGAHECFVFDGSYRPVPLTTHVLGLGYVGNGGKQFHFWQNLDKEVANIVHKFSGKRPSIVFCHSKAETERLAELLASHGLAKRKNCHEIAGKTRVQKLQKALLAGMAYHHAGLELEDRRLVESSFLAGKISILCATSTLAMGVNLPAGLVVIKGSRAWRGKSGYQDLDQATVLQMIGRAGRPGFDTSGTAVIMTDNQSKAKYEKIVRSGLDPAQSQLMPKLDDFVNAEISQLVISDINGCLNWLRGTLFYIQYARRKSPHLTNEQEVASFEEEVIQICRDSLRRLEAIHVIQIDEQSHCVPTEAGHIYAGNMVDYDTMGIFKQLPHSATQAQVLRAISEIEGLQRPCRRAEKKYLNQYHKDIKHKLDGPPSKVRVQEPWQKSFVLFQASIGRIQIEDHTLRQETTNMIEFASRMLQALEEYGSRATLFGEISLQAIRLRRAMATSLWSAGSGVLGQFRSLSRDTVTALKFNGISTYLDVAAAAEASIEEAASKNPPFGKNLKAAVAQTLAGALRINAKIEYAAGSTLPSQLICSLEKSQEHEEPGMQRNSESQVEFTLIAFTDLQGGSLIYKKSIKGPQQFQVQLPPKFGCINIHLVSSMVGLDEHVRLPGNCKMEVSEPKRTLRNPSSLSSRNKGKSTRPKDTQTKKVSRNQGKRAQTKRPREKKDQPTEKKATRRKPDPESEHTDQLSFANSGEVTPSPKNSHVNVNSMVAASQPRQTIYQTAYTPPPPRQGLTQSSYSPQQKPNAHVRSTTYNPRIQGSQQTYPSKEAPKHPGRFVSQGPTRDSQQWKLQKNKQKEIQRRHFPQKKGSNPFSRFKFDPNDAEKKLELLAGEVADAQAHARSHTFNASSRDQGWPNRPAEYALNPHYHQPQRPPQAPFYTENDSFQYTQDLEDVEDVPWGADVVLTPPPPQRHQHPAPQYNLPQPHEMLQYEQSAQRHQYGGTQPQYMPMPQTQQYPDMLPHYSQPLQHQQYPDMQQLEFEPPFPSQGTGAAQFAEDHWNNAFFP